MPQRSLRLNRVNENQVVFADPLDITAETKVSRLLQPKRAGSLSVTNAKTQIKSNRTVTVTKPGVDAEPSHRENLSATTALSGSIENRDKLRQLWLDHSHNVTVAIEDGVLDGFLLSSTANLVIDLAGV